MLNPEESGERHYKLILSQTDRASLTAIVGDTEQPKEYSLRVTQNYELFEALIAGKDDFKAICNGLAKLMVVDLALSRDQDNPQLILRSIKSTGRELSQADLIRNFILMGLEPNLRHGSMNNTGGPWKWTSARRPTARISTVSCAIT